MCIINCIINEINADKRLKPDLLKSENGNNFRAISESAILDVIDPILRKYNAYYVIDVKESHLDIREAYGKKGKKFQFIATVVLRITFFSGKEESSTEYFDCNYTESVGMGIDDCDKAMGKAYTYALKYALIKLFRLRYGDDPDHDASEPLLVDPLPVENKSQKAAESTSKEKKSSKKGNKEEPMSESQRDFIIGLMKKKGISDSSILDKFGYEPTRDDFIPMKVARLIIDWLKDKNDLPF